MKRCFVGEVAWSLLGAGIVYTHVCKSARRHEHVAVQHGYVSERLHEGEFARDEVSKEFQMFLNFQEKLNCK